MPGLSVSGGTGVAVAGAVRSCQDSPWMRLPKVLCASSIGRCSRGDNAWSWRGRAGSVMVALGLPDIGSTVSGLRRREGIGMAGAVAVGSAGRLGDDPGP